ncbi:MAG: histidine phosphatase family protein [Nitrospirota bacterium]
MVTKLYLIRHGETEGADAKRYKGHIDVPLSEKGIKQMKRVAKYIVQNSSNSSNQKLNPPSPPFSKGGLGGFLNAVYCSDLTRAVISAEIIAEPHGLKPVIMPELKERNFGIWEGMSFDEIRVKYPEEFEAWANNPLQHSPMGGESTVEVRDRVIGALGEILKNHAIQSTEHRTQNLPTRLACLAARLAAKRARRAAKRAGQAGTEHTPPTHPSPSRGEGKGGGDNLSSENIAIVSHGGVNRVILCYLLGIPLENIFRIEQDFGAVNLIEFYDKYPVVKLINYIVQTVQTVQAAQTEKRP